MGEKEPTNGKRETRNDKMNKRENDGHQQALRTHSRKADEETRHAEHFEESTINEITKGIPRSIEKSTPTHAFVLEISRAPLAELCAFP